MAKSKTQAQDPEFCPLHGFTKKCPAVKKLQAELAIAIEMYPREMLVVRHAIETIKLYATRLEQSKEQVAEGGE